MKENEEYLEVTCSTKDLNTLSSIVYELVCMCRLLAIR